MYAPFFIIFGILGTFFGFVGYLEWNREKTVKFMSQEVENFKKEMEELKEDIKQLKEEQTKTKNKLKQ